MKQKTKSITSQLPNWHLKNKRVLLRIDGNVPLKNGSITDDTRLQSILPTLEHIKQKNGTIILATHIGRPKNKEPELSTQLLIPWLKEHGFTVTFAPDLKDAQQNTSNATTDIILLENLRYNPEEQSQSIAFAQQLASLADVYVNEAFGASHRNDTSIALVPEQFTPEKRTIGLHCQKEINALLTVKENPKRPLVFILGGGKVADKLSYMLKLFPLADSILVCPALVFTLMKAQGKEIGRSLVADSALSTAKKILNSPNAATKLIFPTDYQVAKKTIDGPLNSVRADKFTKDMVGIAIGPETIKKFSEIIEQAGTIFFNGPMGFMERPETMHATCALLKAMKRSHAFTIVGGGDAVQSAHHCGVASAIDHVSTGGGAALAFLSGVSLPGLIFFM